MFEYPQDGRIRVLSLAIPIDAKPLLITKRGTQWLVHETHAAQIHPYTLITRIQRCWAEACAPFSDEISFEIIDDVAAVPRSYRLDAIYTPPPDSDALDTKVDLYVSLLIDTTRDLTRMLGEYKEGIQINGEDMPICYGKRMSDSLGKIFSENKVAIDAAIQWLAQDARDGSIRGDIIAYMPKGRSIIIPGAPGRYPTREDMQSMICVGAVDSPNDKRHVALLRPKKKGKCLEIRVSPALRDSVIKAQLDRCIVEATLMKTYITVAGAHTFEAYELLDFKTLDSGLFPSDAMEPVKGDDLST